MVVPYFEVENQEIVDRRNLKAFNGRSSPYKLYLIHFLVKRPVIYTKKIKLICNRKTNFPLFKVVIQIGAPNFQVLGILVVCVLHQPLAFMFFLNQRLNGSNSC